MKKLNLALACLSLAGCGSRDEPPPKTVVTVKAARAELADVQFSVRAPATLFPREQANLAARLTAPVRELRVRKGDAVSKGQVLALLENRDLLARKSEAAAAVADAQAMLRKMSAGTLPSDVERARGQAATAEAALNQARKIYERRRQLFEEGAIPNRELLISETELAQAKTSYEVARKALDLLMNQSREQDIQIAESRLEQAKARLALVEVELGFTEIRSPFSGVITEQFIYPGDMAKPDSSMFTVMDLSVMIARAQVPESEAEALRAGRDCAFAPIDRTDTISRGKVTVVNRAVDPARRTVEVWCEIPNPPGSLRAGVYGNAVIFTGQAPRSVVAPLSAVQFVEGTRRGSVLVVDGKRIAHKRDVEAGEVFDGKVQIKSGLQAGDTVIIEGGFGVLDGTEVRIDEGAR